MGAYSSTTDTCSVTIHRCKQRALTALGKVNMGDKTAILELALDKMQVLRDVSLQSKDYNRAFGVV